MGKVYLVGAGPGSVDLLTIRAARLIQSADVILHDALAGIDVLQLASGKTRLINVGKRRGKKSFDQEDINALMIHSARTARVVVRLKGGDPMIFGRAAEEMLALRKAKIEFEVVPGVTAACSAAAEAKVSLTDRRIASEVSFITAHLSEDNSSESWIDSYNGRTLVIYMPGTDYERLGNDLLKAGAAAATPCVVMSRIGSPDQQTVTTSVGQLGATTTLPTPALLIVGEVAANADIAVRAQDLTGIRTTAGAHVSYTSR